MINLPTNLPFRSPEFLQDPLEMARGRYNLVVEAVIDLESSAHAKRRTAEARYGEKMTEAAVLFDNRYKKIIDNPHIPSERVVEPTMQDMEVSHTTHPDNIIDLNSDPEPFSEVLYADAMTQDSASVHADPQFISSADPRDAKLHEMTKADMVEAARQKAGGEAKSTGDAYADIAAIVG